MKVVLTSSLNASPCDVASVSSDARLVRGNEDVGNSDLNLCRHD